MCRLEGHRGDVVLNAALVGATEDLEGATVSPFLVPRVLNKPVVGAVLSSETDDLDSVAAKGLAAGVLVHATLVRGEVSVHGEGSGHGAVLHDVGHDLLHAVEGVGLGSLVLVLSVALGVARLGAALLAAGSGVLAGRAGWVLGGRGHVVGAGSKRVGLAGGAAANVGVVTTGDNASAGHPVESRGGLATVASLGHTAEEARAAGGGVLGGELDVIAGGNALAVLEGLGRAEGPARAAGRLVADLADDGALGPLRAGVEVGGQGLGVKDGVLVTEDFLGGRQAEVVGVVAQVGAAQVGNVVSGVEASGVGVGDPGGAGLVHLIGDLGEVGADGHLHELGGRGGGRESSSKNELHLGGKSGVVDSTEKKAKNVRASPGQAIISSCGNEGGRSSREAGAGGGTRDRQTESRSVCAGGRGLRLPVRVEVEP